MGEVFRRVEHPQEPVAASARSGFACTVPWGNDLIPSAPIERPNRLLDLGIADDEEAPSLHVAAARRADTGFEIIRTSSPGTGSVFSRRIERVVRMISNRSTATACSVILSL